MSEIIPKVRIHCGVKYEEKMKAKNLGAKWNPDRKMWYFEYSLKQFFDDENMHTHIFKPFSISVINGGDLNKISNIPVHVLSDLIYSKAKVRYLNAVALNKESKYVDKETDPFLKDDDDDDDDEDIL